MRERQQMRNHSPAERYDLCWIDGDGGYHHICRYSSKSDAANAKERLATPTEEEQALIGLPANPTLELISH